ncbi:putative linoleate 9S-lipoxygenase 5-like isoform X1 [Hibiscus syriacus]|uniref:Linoleate 9S-lipoxygenase 5-like isoform X1 n=1 Tax=Hibiscus syriacus TaxID=106335 RepID=A0A6A3AL03_HIBSY|nr:putative linoleate 9S-lipoxygenase 5-like isoform X1 [Hibiscus syriacus]
MAISTIQKLTSHIHRLPSLSSHIFTRSPATLSPSKKVSDRIVKIFAIHPEGQKPSHRLEEIDACSAECEVNIVQEWLERLPPRTYDEEYVLVRNSRGRILNKHSRLGCQVVLTPQLQGMVVAVPEPKPWDIP